MTRPMLAPLRGRVAWIFGDDFDVDQIVGVKNIKVQDPDALARLALDYFDDEFRQQVRPSDFLLAGSNFGYGHPHFQSMRAMRKLGIAAVLANSFFPVYWRGEISNGFPQIAGDLIASWLQRWDEIEIDFAASLVRRLADGETMAFQPYASSELETLSAGGFRPRLARSLAAQTKENSHE